MTQVQPVNYVCMTLDLGGLDNYVTENEEIGGSSI